MLLFYHFYKTVPQIYIICGLVVAEILNTESLTYFGIMTNFMLCLGVMFKVQF